MHEVLLNVVKLYAEDYISRCSVRQEQGFGESVNSIDDQFYIFQIW